MSNQRILVIDDDVKLTQLIGSFLESKGFDVSIANSGQDGLRLVSEFDPDLVILDVMMPGMDGWTTCERLRKVSDVPIIMLTARGTDLDIMRGVEKGVDDYIVKPFRVAQLLARIKSALRRRIDKANVENR
jgi:DNA-binding response OmpR family regulator